MVKFHLRNTNDWGTSKKRYLRYTYRDRLVTGGRTCSRVRSEGLSRLIIKLPVKRYIKSLAHWGFERRRGVHVYLS